MNIPISELRDMFILGYIPLMTIATIVSFFKSISEYKKGWNDAINWFSKQNDRSISK